MNITITRFPYESQLGGVETVVLNLAKGLRKKGHNVSFVGSCSVLLDMFEDEGFLTTELMMPKSPVSKWSLLIFVILYPFVILQFINVLKGMKSGDVIYMLSLSEKIVMTKMAKKRGIRIVWGEHEALMYGDRSFRRWLYKNPFLKKYRENSKLAKVVTVSKDLEKQFEELGGVSNLTCIPNGIDTDFFRPNFFKVYREKGDKFIIGTTGRLKKEKGMKEFLHLAEELIPKIPNVSFVIAGDGTEKESLLKFVKEKNIEKYVTFLGKVPHEQIREVYNMFNVAVFLSKELETFGLTPLEAMAMRKATICTSNFGFLTSEIEKDLLVFKSNEINKIAEGIVGLYKNESLRRDVEEKGYRIVKKHFSLGKMVEEYEQAFL